MTIATDIICGFPTETPQNFEETLSLCDKYKFPHLFINQFFPRPGTPAALMARIPAQEVKMRTRTLTDLFYSYEPYGRNVGEIEEVLVTEISHDKKHYVGHNKSYEQVLLPICDEFMGKLVTVKIVSASKFSMIGEPLDRITMPGLVEPLVNGQVSGVVTTNMSTVESHSIGKPMFALLAIFVAVIVRIFWLVLEI